LSPGLRCRTRSRGKVFARTIDDILWGSRTGRESEAWRVKRFILVSGDDKVLSDGLLVCGLTWRRLRLVRDWRVRLLENRLRLVLLLERLERLLLKGKRMLCRRLV
jgi:hypothetical protein